MIPVLEVEFVLLVRRIEITLYSERIETERDEW
jgi:hypothetical protein